MNESVLDWFVCDLDMIDSIKITHSQITVFFGEDSKGNNICATITLFGKEGSAFTNEDNCTRALTEHETNLLVNTLIKELL